MERDWPKWSYLYIVFETVNDEEANEPITVGYVNGVRSMTFENSKKHEHGYALSQAHVDFMDMFGEAGWELVSHEVLATTVARDRLTYPEMRHFLVFKRPWTANEEVEVDALMDLFRERLREQ